MWNLLFKCLTNFKGKNGKYRRFFVIFWNYRYAVENDNYIIDKYIVCFITKTTWANNLKNITSTIKTEYTNGFYEKNT